MLFTTLFVVPLITDTLSEPQFVTYTYPLFELTDTPFGDDPTVMFFTTLFVVPLITDTLLNVQFLTATYTYPLFVS